MQVRTLHPEIRGDAKGEIEARDWEEARRPYADRMMQKLEEYAPGTGDLVLDRAVFSPKDLQRHNPNLVGGDSIGGSHHLRQNFVFRTFPGWSNYKMLVENLYMVGAATWPGTGTNATSGYLAAKKILHPHPIRDRLIWTSVVARKPQEILTLLSYRLHTQPSPTRSPARLAEAAPTSRARQRDRVRERGNA